MSEPTLQDCINYMRSQIKQMEKYPKNYEFNLPYYRKTVELLETRGTTDGNCATCIKAVVIDDRPHGKWVEHGHYTYCSECGEMCATLYDFCPNCGADMRKEGGEP